MTWRPVTLEWVHDGNEAKVAGASFYFTPSINAERKNKCEKKGTKKKCGTKQNYYMFFENIGKTTWIKSFQYQLTWFQTNNIFD